MAMVPFHARFRELAARETRTATVERRPGLPDGEYDFLELYCDEPDCDCRRVIIDVMSPSSGSKIWATINFGWESLEFYEKWMRDKEGARDVQGATLDPLNPQTEYSPALLELFEYVLRDQAYVQRLERHYEQFKSDLCRKHKPAIQSVKRAKRKKR